MKTYCLTIFNDMHNEQYSNKNNLFIASSDFFTTKEIDIIKNEINDLECVQYVRTTIKDKIKMYININNYETNEEIIYCFLN